MSKVVSSVLSGIRAEYVRLADAFDEADAKGLPIIDLGKQLLAAREKLQAATVDIEFVPPADGQAGSEL